MSEPGQKVFIQKDGALISVSPLSKPVAKLLEAELTYSKKVMLRGWEAREEGSRVRMESIACFHYTGKPELGIPMALVTPAGYMYRITQALRREGYTPMLKDLRPHARPEVFQPAWERMAAVTWKWQQRESLATLLSRQYGQVKLPTGYGKSFMIYAICKMLPKARIAITTHSVDVLEQLRDELSQRLPHIGMVSGRSTKTGSRITCYSGKSLHKCMEPQDLLLVDEVHEWGTDDYMDKVSSQSLRFARRWGFSANVGERTDGADFEIEGMFGPCVVDLDYPTCVTHGCVTPIEIHWTDVVMDRDPGGWTHDDTERERACIWQNEYRNGLIAKDARAIPKDEQVLISVRTIEHAMHLKRLLPEFTLCYSHQGVDDVRRDEFIAAGCISENEPLMTLERRMQLKKRFEHGQLRRVIANTVWKRGVDFRQLQHLIRGDAESSMVSDTQIPGRTSRVCGETGKEVSKVRDYCDQFNETFRGRGDKRRGHYRMIGWPQFFPDRRVIRGSQVPSAKRLGRELF